MKSQSEEWEKINQVKKTAKGVQTIATLVRPNFWNGVSLCLRVFEPLVKVLHGSWGYQAINGFAICWDLKG